MTAAPGPSISPSLYRRAADQLLAAARHRTPCRPIRELLAEANGVTEEEVSCDFESGYAVQRLVTHAALADGRKIIGAKIGLTSPAVQQQLGVDRPDLGVLFADMARSEDQPIDFAELLQPRIEAEVAFFLGADLDRPDLDLHMVRDAVDTAVAALEIVDSRVAGWDIRLVDTVADNASSGLYLLGAKPERLRELDLSAITMAMTADGELVSEGSGAACLGDPCVALLWLARTMRQFGSPLRAGDLVLSGALGPMVAVRPDTTYAATIEGLGTVRASFGASI